MSSNVGILQRIGRRLTQPIFKRSLSIDQAFDLMQFYTGGDLSVFANSGVVVTPETAIRAGAVFACVRVLAESVAALPLHLYRHMENGGKEKALDHELYQILHDSPNPEMTSYEYRETIMGHLALRSNAYSFIDKDVIGRVKALWPLHPGRMQVWRANALMLTMGEDVMPIPGVRGSDLLYKYTPLNGPQQIYKSDQILHYRGLGLNGLIGYSISDIGQESIGNYLAAQKYSAKFFANDARPGGVLEHPAKLGEEALKNLKKSWEDMHRGLDNAHRIAVLEEGLSYKAVGIEPKKAQLIEAKKLSRSEIAGLFRVPPHLIMDLEKATYSNIEQQDLGFVKHTLMPWLVRIEQRNNLSLLTPEDRKKYFCKHNVNALLRGDIDSRYKAYATGRQWGFLSANEIREFEDMNPIDGGDEYLVPMNMSEVGESEETDEAGGGEPEDQKTPIRQIGG